MLNLKHIILCTPPIGLEPLISRMGGRRRRRSRDVRTRLRALALRRARSRPDRYGRRRRHAACNSDFSGTRGGGATQNRPISPKRCTISIEADFPTKRRLADAFFALDKRAPHSAAVARHAVIRHLFAEFLVTSHQRLVKNTTLRRK